MASIFEQTIVPKINFSNFVLNETQLISCNFGQLIPCYIREVLPNDVFTLSAFADVQFAPMVAPMMQNVNASLHFFYVPNRIVWDDFETFITGSEEGHVLSEENIPSQAGVQTSWFWDIMGDNGNDLQGSIFDYLGLPNALTNDYNDAPDFDVVSDIPLRDYFKIWYDYYRDENLQYELDAISSGTPVDLYSAWKEWRATNDWLDTYSSKATKIFGYDFAPFYRAYRKDYFTAALPTPQKGEPVTLALGTSAPVSIAAQNIVVSPKSGTPSDSALRFTSDGNPDSLTAVESLDNFINNSGFLQFDNQNRDSITGFRGNLSALTGIADLRNASALTVEALREAFAVQEILESLSMRGSRYTEFLKGNFGVTPDDYKLQRPQFLGGLVTPVQVQQVLQNAGLNSDEGQITGYAAGHAFAAAGQRVFRQRFKEHGYIIGIMSVMPQAYYYQGIPRHFMRKDRFDYYMVQTAHLGEQAIMNQELYFQADEYEKNNKVFGYIPRWAEYKTSTNGIHGDFRGNLNYYHMARVFNQLPTLSEKFISTKDVQTRPWSTWETARPTLNHLIWANLFFKVTASRPMPYHSVPKIM